jgi:hypothetical protein
MVSKTFDFSGSKNRSRQKNDIVPKIRVKKVSTPLNGDGYVDTL